MPAQKDGSGRFFLLGIRKIVLVMVGIVAILMICNVVGYQLLHNNLTWMNISTAPNDQIWLDGTSSYIGRVLIISIIGAFHAVAAAILLAIGFGVLYLVYYGVAALGGYKGSW